MLEEMKAFRAYVLIGVLVMGGIQAIKGQQDPEAEPYLDKIARDLDPGSSLELTFDYIREDLKEKTRVEGDGTLYLSGDRYKIEMEGFVVYFDGEKQYSLNLENEEVYISMPDPEDKEFIFSDPITLLRTYKDEFKYRIMGEASIQGIQTLEIQLYPLELGGPFALLKIFIDLGKNELKAIQVRHKEGILYSMILTSFKSIDPLDISFFRFSESAYPNVDVIELVY